MGQFGGFDGRGSYDPDGSIVSYLWDFGDGGVWGDSSVELRAYSRPGTYTVTLYVEDDDGAWSSDRLVVTVGSTNQRPVAKAGPDKTLTVGQLATFDGRGSYDPDGVIVSYLWSFGDGGAWGDSAVEQRAYSSPGTYTVALYVRDDDGVWTADTAVVTVRAATTNAAPVARAGADRQATVGQALSFDGRSSSDSDGTIVAYAWSFGDGGTASTAVASHAWAAAGTYSVVLSVRDDDGAWSSDAAVVTVTGSTSSGGEWLGVEKGSSNQQTTGVARTGTSDVVIGGLSNGTATIGGLTLSGVAGRIDGYVAKYTGSGAVSWARQLTPTSSTTMAIVEGVAGDGSGNLVAVGRFTGSMRAGSTTLTSAGGQDAFVVKYGATGTVQWARRFGGTLDDVGYAVGIDTQGSVFVTGSYTGAVNFGGGLLQESKILPAPTLYVLKLTSSGGHTWSRSFAGSASEVGYGLAVAPNGDVVVGGTFTDRLDLGGGQFRTFGVTDGFVLQLTPTGAHRWSRQVGGTNLEDVVGVATDANGNVAITGKFRGDANFGGGVLSANPTVSDMFVASYSGTGAHRWSRRGGSALNEDAASGVAMDGSGSVFVTGSFLDSATFGTGTVTSAGGRDVFLVEYSSTGAYQGVDAWGGSGNDEGLDAAAWATRQVAVSGFFRNTAVVATEVVTSTGGSDGLTARVNR